MLDLATAYIEEQTNERSLHGVDLARMIHLVRILKDNDTEGKYGESLDLKLMRLCSNLATLQYEKLESSGESGEDTGSNEQ